MHYLAKDDPEVARIIQKEEARMENTLDLIAAENHAPRSILDFMPAASMPMIWKAWQFFAPNNYSVPITPTSNPTAGFRPTWRFTSRSSMSATESFR